MSGMGTEQQLGALDQAINAPAQGHVSPCVLDQVRHDLRRYRDRLGFVASNIPLSDLHSRGLLRELLDFDRWLGGHLERCPACQLMRGAE